MTTPRAALAKVERAYAKMVKAESAMRTATAELRATVAEAAEDAGLTDSEMADALGVTRARVYQYRTARNR